MDSLNSHEPQRIPFPSSDLTPAVANTNHESQKPKDLTYRYTFRDFVTPDPLSVLYVTGDRATLDSLDLTLSSGACVNHYAHPDPQLALYSPLVVAVNYVCKLLFMQDHMPVTENDLVDIQRQPWFNALLKQYAKMLKNEKTLNFSQLDDITQLTGDRIVVILEALTLIKRLPKVELGVVFLRQEFLPHAYRYLSHAGEHKVTAWIVVDTRYNVPRYYGIGSSAVRQERQKESEESQENEENESDQDADGDVEENMTGSLTPAPRKTASRVTAQQVPLPAGLSADNILSNHKDRLQYNNILKVALVHSNQHIADVCKAETLSKQAKLQQSSGVVKRINTGLSWIEREFDIPSGAFRTVFDRERKANGIAIRGKDGVDGAVLAENASKINAAMTWVKTGGPRPVSTDTIDVPVPLLTPAFDTSTHIFPDSGTLDRASSKTHAFTSSVHAPVTIVDNENEWDRFYTTLDRRFQ